jgi:hypothetical protein
VRAVDAGRLEAAAGRVDRLGRAPARLGVGLHVERVRRAGEVADDGGLGSRRGSPAPRQWAVRRAIPAAPPGRPSRSASGRSSRRRW